MKATIAFAATLLVTVSLGLTACAPLTERQKEDLEYRRVEYEEEFLAFRSACFAQGGRIFVFATGELDRDGIPNVGDRYHCV